jgi:hypothetical protein
MKETFILRQAFDHFNELRTIERSQCVTIIPGTIYPHYQYKLHKSPWWFFYYIVMCCLTHCNVSTDTLQCVKRIIREIFVNYKDVFSELQGKETQSRVRMSPFHSAGTRMWSVFISTRQDKRLFVTLSLSKCHTMKEASILRQAPVSFSLRRGEQHDIRCASSTHIAMLLFLIILKNLRPIENYHCFTTITGIIY